MLSVSHFFNLKIWFILHVGVNGAQVCSCKRCVSILSQTIKIKFLAFRLNKLSYLDLAMRE